MHYLCTAFLEEKLTGCSSVRLECLVWDQVVEGSNPFIPTKKGVRLGSLFVEVKGYSYFRIS